jgi:Holliday junction resolvase RusA-like endonuclease
MSGAVTIMIGGPPTAMGPPQMTRQGSPPKTRRYEAHGRLAAQQAMAVRAELTVDLPVPSSWPAERRAAALRGEIRPTSRPDTAINAIVGGDDSLVVDLVAIKRYASVPALTITIAPLPALAAREKTCS